MTDEIGRQVTRLIAEQALLEPRDIAPETTLEELGLDSLGVVELVFGIEETFDVTVPFNANDPSASEFDFSRVGHVIDGVRQLVAAKG